MGVYIKNMSIAAFKKIMELGLKVDDDLLVEVKEPHGRLIDANDYFNGEYGDARIFIDDAPTVIEAEVE